MGPAQLAAGSGMRCTLAVLQVGSTISMEVNTRAAHLSPDRHVTVDVAHLRCGRGALPCLGHASRRSAWGMRLWVPLPRVPNRPIHLP